MPRTELPGPFPQAELICALTPFDALCGFRDPHATLAVLATIETPALDRVRGRLAAAPDADGLHQLLEHLLTLPAEAAGELVDAVVEAAEPTVRPTTPLSGRWRSRSVADTRATPGW